MEWKFVSYFLSCNYKYYRWVYLLFNVLFGLLVVVLLKYRKRFLEIIILIVLFIV